MPIQWSVKERTLADASKPGKVQYLRDPRVPFALLLALYVTLGCTLLGFNRSFVQVVLTVLTGCSAEVLIHYVFKRKWIFPLSALITSLGLSILVNYSHSHLLLVPPILMAICSKYIFTVNGRHVFNPGMFGLVMALLAGRELYSLSPAYQWGGNILMAAFITMLAIVLFVFRIGRIPLILSFLFFYTIQTAIRAYIMRWHVPASTIFFGTLTDPSLFLFTFYMITDPKTSPDRSRDQIIRSFLVVCLDFMFHMMQALYTLHYALFLLMSLRWAALHVKNYLNLHEFPSLTPAFSGVRQRVCLAAVCSFICALVVFLSSSGRAGISEPGFYFRKISPDHSHIDSRMSRVLAEVDPRVQHVAKWLLSVGDAVATGDVDNDGLIDVFLTNTVKRAEDRNALYRNLGGFRFERIDIPCLDEFSRHPEKYGLSGGAVFVDYDNSGYQSLLLCTAYGKSRLLKNLLPVTGKLEFRDVSEEAGVHEHSTSIAATFLDMEKDGRLDLFLGNSLRTHLGGYSNPVPLTIFNLPQAEFAGDRRPFHFMHHGWHNAENGGLNSFFKNAGDGNFIKMNANAFGMPETHWTLAIGTADLNQDGYTDVYCANDFGPDDLYLNDMGKRFLRVIGKTFSSVGRDTYKGMNVSIGDMDNRGEWDIYVSNSHAPLQAEGSLFWKTFNTKHSFVPEFKDMATARGVLNERRFGWGAAMGDINRDGWLDLVQANGMVDDTPDKKFDKPRSYWYAAEKLMRSHPDIHAYADGWGDLRGYEILGRQYDRVYLSRGRKSHRQFVDVASQVGLTEKGNSRGVALADLDNDGDLDLIITHQFIPCNIYENQCLASKKPNWIGIRLQGDGIKVNAEAVGTRAILTYTHEGKTMHQLREVQMVNGFCAQGDRRLLFGLSDYEGEVELEVHWYGAELKKYSKLALNGYHTIIYPASGRE